MPTIRPLKTLFSLSILLIAGLLLTACGDDVDVSPAGAATATASGTPAAPAPPAATPSVPAAPITLAGTPAASVTVGQSYAFQPTVSAGTSKVTFQIQGKPAWAAFNASTGALTGTPA